jgi:hypothetical protein
VRILDPTGTRTPIPSVVQPVASRCTDYATAAHAGCLIHLPLEKPLKVYAETLFLFDLTGFFFIFYFSRSLVSWTLSVTLFTVPGASSHVAGVFTILSELPQVISSAWFIYPALYCA